jgi:phage tail sheath protein FI
VSKEYLRPGVFVEEVPPGEQPIQAVGTSTGAFIGIAEKGALDKPKLVTNWSQFVKDFGGHRRDSFLAHAVQGFFLNGGSRCFVVRVASATAAIAAATLSDRAGAPLDTLGVQALNEGEWGNRLSLDVADGTKIPATEFMLVVKLDGEVVETWDDLSLDPEAENYVEAVVNDDSAYIQVTDLESMTSAPDNRPAVQVDTPLVGGADGASDITDADYVGNSADRTGLYAFDTVDEVNNLCVPGVSTQTVVQAALDYCDGRGDCGFIVDSPEGGDPVSTKTFRKLFDSSRGYYYFPRIKVLDPLTKRVKVVPPSGHIAGVFARSDGERGVHKAPSNEVIRGAVGLEYEVTDGEQEILNPAGVNCIRVFRGRRGPRFDAFARRASRHSPG